MNINELSEKVINHIDGQMEKNRDQYISDGGFVRIDIDIALESVLEIENVEIDDNTFKQVVEHASQDVESIENELKEALEDEEYYRRDPLGYHGMSQRDFV